MKGAKEEAITPMMQQYLRIKRQYQDCLVFFRLGDFYELFYEDAKIASSILDIALTSRQKVPMCGVPYHAAQSYLNKLLRHGYRVAVCEQVEDPKMAKGVVKREVVRVLTPGTALEAEPEEVREGVVIISLFLEDDGWGLASLDILRGRIKATQGEEKAKERLIDEIYRLSPKEILFPQTQENEISKLIKPSFHQTITFSPVEDWTFDLAHTRSLILSHFGVESLEGFGLEGKGLACRTAGALLHYLRNLRPESLRFIEGITSYEMSEFMILDLTAIRNLELVRNIRDGREKDSLLDVMDMTVTAAGARLLRSWLLEPLLNLELICRRQDAVEDFFYHTVERQELRKILKQIGDLERLAGKISLGIANPRDLVSLKKSLWLLPEVRKLIETLNSPWLKEIKASWDNAAEIAELINQAIMDEPATLIDEGGIIKEGFSAELDELRSLSHSGKTFIASLEKRERERTGIASLKVRYNQVFGYFIEVTKPNIPLVPPDYIRKQTLVNSERFVTPELKEYEEKVLSAEEKIRALENQLFLEIREKIATQIPKLKLIARRLAELDVLSALAQLAIERRYVRPEVNESDRIWIKDGRHPIIEKTLAEPFVPNDVDLDREERQILIITGPNMGGKSTYIRQVALICLMAQMGSFVPASEAKIGLVDRIFTRIGATDYLSLGQSTFMVEMIETANILHHATPRSLILLDEIGRGTSTFDGLSIAWAVAEYLHDREDIRPKTLFATHYHELTALELTLNRVKNYHVMVKEHQGEVIFLRKVVPGPTDQSYGLHVAKLAGVPRSVINRAKEILFNLERKEFDPLGQPKLSRKRFMNQSKDQLWLFAEDRRWQLLEELEEDLLSQDLDRLTPLEALQWLNLWKKRLRTKT
ncbi:MAG: DNA mismatch repair protein MutS [Candidatus Aminicenantes bacterium]|nr:DNA mismatch repair protein MutS [Candidatus Aminicenantes bacterium]